RSRAASSLSLADSESEIQRSLQFQVLVPQPPPIRETFAPLDEVTHNRIKFLTLMAIIFSIASTRFALYVYGRMERTVRTKSEKLTKMIPIYRVGFG
ncbi:unnamed protein product, partial [Amoebophrya sp. A25]